MYSGISAMQAHKKQMDVIGNDIANVNTVGYKQSDVTFKEAFVTTLRNPLPGEPGIQTGLGVQVAQISRDFTGGSLMETGKSANMAISGNGFFIVSSESPQAQLLDGATTLQPITAATEGTYDIDIDINGTSSTLSVDLRDGDTAEEIVAKLNQQISGTLQGNGYTAPAAAVPAGEDLNITLNGTALTLNTGALAGGETAATIASSLNTALAAQVPPVTDIQFAESPAGEIQLQTLDAASVDTVSVVNDAFSQSLGFTTAGAGNVQAATITDQVSFDLNLGTVRLAPKVNDFDLDSISIADGTSNPGAMSVLGYATGGASATSADQGVVALTRAGDFVLDTNGDNTYLITSEGRRLQGVMGDPPSAFDANTIVDDINLRKGLSSSQMVSDYAVGMDGMIRRAVDGGPMESVGRVALAIADNPGGLKALGSNLYEPNEAASVRDYSGPDENGNGQIFQGYLENSNVDLASEFTDMIVTQRGFQANSKTISTSDELLQELIRLKR